MYLLNYRGFRTQRVDYRILCLLSGPSKVVSLINPRYAIVYVINDSQDQVISNLLNPSLRYRPMLS